MAEITKIAWTDHTFNPWRGCSKVSAGCANCYADTQSKRNPNVLGIWGPEGTRVVASEAMWREPEKWNAQAEAEGRRHRVFCASLADVFEDWKGVPTYPNGNVLCHVEGSWCNSWKLEYAQQHATRLGSLGDIRSRLWDLIHRTPWLDWQLLTKRPENYPDMLPWWHGVGIPDNVWLGVSVENQEQAEKRIPLLLKAPAAVRFLSCEPLLGPLDLSAWLPRPASNGTLAGYWHEKDPSTPRIRWVIVGGESGPQSRICEVKWVRSLLWQCKQAGVSCFVKQLGSRASDEVNGIAGRGLIVPAEALPLVSLRLVDPKGGDLEEWPADLRVQQFPEVRS